MRFSTELLKSEAMRRLKSADLLFILSAIPVLLLFALAPGTFELSWAGFGKLGRGGLFIILFFLAFELWDFRKTAKPRLDRRHVTVTVAILALGLFYFGAAGAASWFTDLIYSVGKALGAAGEVSNSWLMATDYSAMTVYLIALSIVLFAVRAIRAIITPIVLSIGMVIFYLLDAFFPYGSIGPLQFWANFIVAAVGILSKIFGLPIYGFSNLLTINGTHGFFRLAVYWPSVGVQSMLIYSLVMILLAAKLDSPPRRKVIYASIGVIGTIFLNVVRIFIIAYYGYAYAYTGQELDAFHNSIGEILFPIWIVAFLAIVLHVEGRLAQTARKDLRREPPRTRSPHPRTRTPAGHRSRRKEMTHSVS
jgi:thaumarchaeosortase